MMMAEVAGVSWRWIGVGRGRINGMWSCGYEKAIDLHLILFYYLNFLAILDRL